MPAEAAGCSLFKLLFREKRVLICHDNPSFILNDKPRLVERAGQRIVLELNSLSKSQNMAGWRVGMLCG
jgi:aspartate/methionine/tyrosine aminotransferase